MATNTKAPPKGEENKGDAPNASPAAGTALEVVDAVSGEIVAADDAYAGYAEDAGQGFENQTSEDVGIPFIVLAQPLSPEVQAEGSEVKPGTWINRGTGDVFAGGVDFVPALTRHVYREWSSKEPSNSAPVGDHEIDSELIVRVRRDQQFGEYTHPDNPEHPLIETFEVYGIQVTPEGGGVPAVITFSSTGIRAYKDWILRARSIIIALPSGKKINPPLFSHVYRLTSKRVEKKPHVWWVPAVSFASPEGAVASRLLPSSDLYGMAKALKEAVQSGQAKVQQPTRDGAEEALKRADTDTEKAPY